MTQLWRHTGHGVEGDLHAVTFEHSRPIATEDRNTLVDTVRGLASLGLMRGLVTNFVNTLRIDLSEDDGKTWRTVYEWPDD